MKPGYSRPNTKATAAWFAKMQEWGAWRERYRETAVAWATVVILDRGWGKPQQDVSVTQRTDVADRIIARWKENLAKLNRDEPLTIEGQAVDVAPK